MDITKGFSYMFFLTFSSHTVIHVLIIHFFGVIHPQFNPPKPPRLRKKKTHSSVVSVSRCLCSASCFPSCFMALASSQWFRLLAEWNGSGPGWGRGLLLVPLLLSLIRGGAGRLRRRVAVTLPARGMSTIPPHKGSLQDAPSTGALALSVRRRMCWRRTSLGLLEIL